MGNRKTVKGGNGVDGLRRIIGWTFAFTSLLSTYIAFNLVAHAIHRYRMAIPFRAEIISLIFSILAIIFGVSWWAVVKRKPASCGWGVASCAIYVLLPLVEIVRFSQPILGHRGLLMAAGVVGLFAFLSKPSQPAGALSIEANRELESKGFPLWIKGLFIALIAIPSVSAYIWWVLWCERKGIPSNQNIAHRTLLLALLVVPMFNLIIAVRELSGIVAGLTLGMRLRTVTVGPLQWRISSGKWTFQFKPSDVFAGGTGAGLDSSDKNSPRLYRTFVILAGQVGTLISGFLALWIAFNSAGDSPVQVGGLLAFFGAFCLVICTGNLIPSVESIYKASSDNTSVDFH
jgi:hypothetical protein